MQINVWELIMQIQVNLRTLDVAHHDAVTHINCKNENRYKNHLRPMQLFPRLKPVIADYQTFEGVLYDGGRGCSSLLITADINILCRSLKSILIITADNFEKNYEFYENQRYYQNFK